MAAACAKPRSRLALRIYLFGVVQFIIVLAALFAIVQTRSRAPIEFDDAVALFVTSVVDSKGDRAAVAQFLGRLKARLDCSVAVYDENNRLVAEAPGSHAPADRAQVYLSSRDLISPVPMQDGRQWHLVFLKPPVGSPPPEHVIILAVLILVVVGISSLLIARSLARPLARLTIAAHDFGAGKLDTRVNMARTDELGLVATAFDHMADRVTHALRVEKELLANVSHELRTPLQRIHIAVELAAEGDANMARKLLGGIAEDLSELERIVEDVLTATRLSLQEGSAYVTTASPPLRRETVDLRGLVDKATGRFRAAHPNRPLRVIVAGDLPAVTVDVVLLRRVIDNLLDNAHKYTEDTGAEIALAVGWWSKALVIEVRDKGAGISPEDLARVFELFFRADRSRARTTGGLGLGLPLARRIVEAHQGTLTIESVVGAGTTARIELPLHAT